MPYSARKGVDGRSFNNKDRVWWLHDNGTTIRGRVAAWDDETGRYLVQPDCGGVLAARAFEFAEAFRSQSV